MGSIWRRVGNSDIDCVIIAGLTLNDLEPVLQPGFRHVGQQSLEDTWRTSF